MLINLFFVAILLFFGYLINLLVQGMRVQSQINTLITNYLLRQLDDETDLANRAKELKHLAFMVDKDECE